MVGRALTGHEPSISRHVVTGAGDEGVAGPPKMSVLKIVSHPNLAHCVTELLYSLCVVSVSVFLSTLVWPSWLRWCSVCWTRASDPTCIRLIDTQQWNRMDY